MRKREKKKQDRRCCSRAHNHNLASKDKNKHDFITNRIECDQQKKKIQNKMLNR